MKLKLKVRAHAQRLGLLSFPPSLAGGPRRVVKNTGEHRWPNRGSTTLRLGLRVSLSWGHLWVLNLGLGKPGMVTLGLVRLCLLLNINTASMQLVVHRSVQTLEPSA